MKFWDYVNGKIKEINITRNKRKYILNRSAFNERKIIEQENLTPFKNKWR